VYFDHVEFGNGKPGRHNRVVEGAGHPGVAILPISSEGIGLVRQYRHAVAEDVWEIPRGNGDSADPEAEARRELQEETGLRPLELTALGTTHPNSAILATRVSLFAARCAPTPGDTSPDASEQLEFRWFAIETAMEAAGAGQIADAMTLSALLRARLQRLI